MTTMMKGATTTLTRNINRSAHGLLNFGGANAMQMRQFRAGIRVSPRRCYFGARNFVQPSLQRVNRREGVCSLHADSIRQSSTTTTTTVASSFCFPFDKRMGNDLDCDYHQGGNESVRKSRSRRNEERLPFREISSNGIIGIFFEGGASLRPIPFPRASLISFRRETSV